MENGPQSTPIGEAALKLGMLAVIVAALTEIGSLGYYGLGLSSQSSALQHLSSGEWPREVKVNIQNTYIYLLASFYICIASATFVFFNPTLFWIFTSFPMVIVDFLVQSVVQSGKIFIRLNPTGTFSKQRLAWIAYCCFLGGIASPAFLVGTTTVKIAVHITFIVVGAIILLSLIAPAGKFVPWLKYLYFFDICVIISSIGSAVFPITTSAGGFFLSISFYGGLILFSTYLLCHSQEAQMTALQANTNRPYCSIAMSVPILLDAINIFSRILVMVPPK